jgi:adenylate cyclase
MEKKQEKTQRLLKWSFICGLIGLVISSILGLAISKAFNDYFNNAWVNLLFETRQKHYKYIKNLPSKNIVVVLFDDESDRKLNTFWPYDRAESAKVIDFLRLAGTKAVLFDILYSTPSIDKPDSDLKLAQAVKKAGNIVLGAKFIFEKNVKRDAEITVLKEKFAVNPEYSAKNSSNEDFFFDKEDQYYDVPFKQLLKATKSIGFFNMPQRQDVTRESFLMLCNENECFPSLSFSYLLDLVDTRSFKINTGKWFQIKDIKIPVDNKNLYYVNWLGTGLAAPPGNKYIYDTVSAWQLIESYNSISQLAEETGKTDRQVFQEWYTNQNDLRLKKDPDIFKNKIVFVGVSSSGAHDLINTPIGTLPGVYSHAFVLDNLINQNFIRIMPFYINFVILLILCFFTSFTIIVASSKDSITFQLLPAGYFILFCMLCIELFGKWNIIINWFTPALGIGLSAFIAFLGYFVLEGKDKKRVKEAMSNYLSPQILKMVIENPEKLKPSASTRKELTILFSDIRGFTTFSESNPPELVVRMLNEYHSEMTAIIFKNKGTLDKFIGDAIMAFWGAPVDVEDHAMLAIKSAVEMQQKLVELNSIWSKVYKHSVHIGIGINTEEVVVGNIGSERFMDYTVIGDGVNLAARLEGLNKTYNTSIIISEHTLRQVEDRVEVNFLDNVKVKGKTTETKIYELIQIKGNELDDTEEYYYEEI